jgi:hypothetical protein
MIRSKYGRVKTYTALTALLLITGACKREYIVQPSVASSDRLSRFWFSPAGENASYLNDTVSLNINGDTISGRIPYYTSLKSLIPSFETNAQSVSVDGAIQQSGVTAQDFTKPVHYTCTYPDGSTQEYVVMLANFTGLPVIRINTENSAPITSTEDYVNAHLVIDGAGLYDNFEGDTKIKGHGNSTWTFPKKPYKLKLDKKQPLLGEPEDKEWVLLANYTDKTQMRNEAALFMGQASALDWTPHARYAEVFLNEVYAGTYQLCEFVKVSDARVNVTDDGYLLEVDQLDRLDPDDVYFQTPHMLVNIKAPDLSQGDDKYNYIKDYVNQAESALFGSQFTDPDQGYAKYLDVPSFVDWYLINEIAKNNDAIFYSSCYMNLVPGGKLKMGPIWDFDIAFGNINYNNNQSPEGFWIRTAPWIDRLFQDPRFVQQVRDRFPYFKSQTQAILDHINACSAMLKWSVIENNNKWQTLYTPTWPNYAVWGSYDNEVIYMKNWFNARMSWLENALMNDD